MIVVLADLIALIETLPVGVYINLPDHTEVTRPGESLGYISKTLKGDLRYNEYR